MATSTASARDPRTGPPAASHAHGPPPPEAAAFSLAPAWPFSSAWPLSHAGAREPPPTTASRSSATARAVPPAPCQHATPHAPPPSAASLPLATAPAVPPAPCRAPAADPTRRTARPQPHASISCNSWSPSSSISHSTPSPQVTDARAPPPHSARRPHTRARPRTGRTPTHGKAPGEAHRPVRGGPVSRIRPTCGGGHACVASCRRPQLASHPRTEGAW